MKRVVTHKNVKIGDKVIPGKDWKYNSNQSGESLYGVVESVPDIFNTGLSSNYWVNVKWQIGKHFGYRVGDNKYDLYFYDKDYKDEEIEALQE